MLSTGVTGQRHRVGGSHPAAVPWVPRLLAIVHGLTEDPEDRGYRPSRFWGQWQLRSISSISNGDERWHVSPPEVRGKAEHGSSMAASKLKAKEWHCSNQATNTASFWSKIKIWISVQPSLRLGHMH